METHSNGILQKTIKTYQNTKISIMKKVTEASNIGDENGFLDNGFIKSQIESLKKEYAFIQNEVSVLTNLDDRQNVEKLRAYRDRQEELLFLMAFYASNSFQNIDYCLELTKNMNTDFTECLQALKAYHEGEFLHALQLFYHYFHRKQALLEHYLINKTYGTLLFQENEYAQAKIFLQKAVEKRPEDIELHKLLKEIYEQLHLDLEKRVETDILSLLGGLS